MNQPPGQFKKPMKSVYLPSSLLTNINKEPLKIVLPAYLGITHIPSDLSSQTSPGLMVFVELNKCFKSQGNVSEGLLGNVIWGFHECGFDEKHVAQGLAELRAKGYIYYSDARDNVVSEFDFDPNKPVWLRYTDKFKALFSRIVM